MEETRETSLPLELYEEKYGFSIVRCFQRQDVEKLKEQLSYEIYDARKKALQEKLRRMVIGLQLEAKQITLPVKAYPEIISGSGEVLCYYVSDKDLWLGGIEKEIRMRHTGEERKIIERYKCVYLGGGVAFMGQPQISGSETIF